MPTDNASLHRAAPRASSPVERLRRARSLADEVAAVLSGRIRGGEYPPGGQLPTEAAIAEAFAVSRTVVREAISKLQAAGLAETRHGIGTFALAQPPAAPFRLGREQLSTVADVIALLEVRIGLETEAAGLAAARRTDAGLRRMREALGEMAAAIDAGSDAAASDFRFHVEIAQATGNRHFAELMNELGSMIIPRTRVNAKWSDEADRRAYLVRVNDEHQSIYRAIVERDAERARAAMRTHLANSRDRLRRAQQALGGEREPARRSRAPLRAGRQPAKMSDN